NRGYYRLLDDTVKNTLHHHYLNQGITKSELTEKHQVTGITYCRTCYNHLAGEVGVLFTEALVKKGLIAIAEDSHFKLLPGAENYFREFGIDIESLRQKRGRFRSEEHTSELQSRFDLVCRLLLEKKKKIQ